MEALNYLLHRENILHFLKPNILRWHNICPMMMKFDQHTDDWHGPFPKWCAY